MGEFGTSFLFAVLFGTATLIGFAVVRFQESAASMPKDLVDLGLTPRLLTRPEMYTLGLSTYVAVLLAVYFLVTLFPDAVLLIASKGKPDMVSTITDLVRDRYSPAFPLAMALVLTSPAFIKFAEPPERLLRRFTQGIAGVPRDVGYVLDVIRSANFFPPKELKEACTRLGISDVCAEKVVQRIWTTAGTLSIRPSDRFIARAIQFSSYLWTVRLSEIGAQPDEGDLIRNRGRAALWQQVDFAVFANFWRLAEPKIERLRGIIKLVHEEGHTLPEADQAEVGDDREMCVMAPAPWEKEIEALQAELSALLAASISTRSVQLDRIVHAFMLFQLESEDGLPSKTDLRAQLVRIQGIGIRVRNQIAQYLSIACVAMLMAGLVLAPYLRKGLDEFNGAMVSGPLPSKWLRLPISPFVDPANTALPDRPVCDRLLRNSREAGAGDANGASEHALDRSSSLSSRGKDSEGKESSKTNRGKRNNSQDVLEDCASELFGNDVPLTPDERKRNFLIQAAPFEWDWATFATLITFTGLSCGVGAMLAYKRRNENLAKSVAVIGRRQDAVPAVSFAGVADMFRVALPAALVFSLLGQISPLNEWVTPISRVVQETKLFAEAINNESEKLGLKVDVGDGQVRAYLAIGLGMSIMVIAGALGPAIVAAVGIAAGERFARGTESNVEGLRAGRRRYLALFVAYLGCVAVPVLAEACVEALQRWINSGGQLEQTIKVQRPAIAPQPSDSVGKNSDQNWKSLVERCSATFGADPKGTEDLDGCICVAEKSNARVRGESIEWTEILACRQNKNRERQGLLVNRNDPRPFAYMKHKMSDATEMLEPLDQQQEQERRFFRRAVFDQLRNISALYRGGTVIILYSVIFVVVARFSYSGRRHVLELGPP